MIAVMDLEWIKQGLKKPGKSQRGLAAALGIDPSGVSRLLAGTRELKAAEIAKVEAYLDAPADLGAPAVRADMAALDVPNLASLPRDIEVRGTAVGGDAASFDFNGEVVDYLRRPPGLIRARKAFAIYVTGTSMAPRFEEGEVVFVHPGRPATPGCDVIVELHGNDGEPGHCYIKRLVRRTATKLTLAQFNPPRNLEIELARVRAVYRILTSAELLGV
jgi:phage repressor protein C with HTH and peptisase S24 domain